MRKTHTVRNCLRNLRKKKTSGSITPFMHEEQVLLCDFLVYTALINACDLIQLLHSNLVLLSQKTHPT